MDDALRSPSTIATSSLLKPNPIKLNPAQEQAVEQTLPALLRVVSRCCSAWHRSPHLLRLLWVPLSLCNSEVRAEFGISAVHHSWPILPAFIYISLSFIMVAIKYRALDLHTWTHINLRKTKTIPVSPYLNVIFFFSLHRVH